MQAVARLRSLFSIPIDNPELLRSQAKAFSRQVPLLYFILVINTLALTSTHLDTAPAYLTIWLPLILYAGSVFRLIKWWRMRQREQSDAQVIAMLRGTIRFSVLLGFGFTAWSLALYPYGDAYAQSFVAFYMAVTVVCIILCLMHMRAAALIVTLMVIPAYTIFFAFSGNPVFVAMALNVCLVAVGLVYMLQTNYRDFASLIETQKALVAKQAETQRLVDENFHLANIDSLTDLPNRRSFFARLNALLAQSGPVPFAIGVIDLDGFKPVNDLYGHASGDKVLIEVGQRLSALMDERIFIARLGGDEFGVIMQDFASPEAVSDFGTAICEALRKPYALPDVTVQISGTAGFALHICGDGDPEHLLERADCALYHAKHVARGRAVMFSEEHEAQMRRHGLIEQALRNADIGTEFSLVYQPIQDIREGATMGFEALMRWASPTLGNVPPDQFIVVAERTGLITNLTEAMLRKALDTARTWPEHLRISFNLSANDIATPTAVERLIDVIRDSGIDPCRIDLEITETDVMHDLDQACAALDTLRALGVQIALDDFGTGYSSLSHVHILPLDKIKIDRSFVAEIESSRTGQNIARTIVSLCNNLKLDCIVEGVETSGQLAILARLGVSRIQGYFFSRPMPAEAIEAYLDEQPQLSRETSAGSRTA